MKLKCYRALRLLGLLTATSFAEAEEPRDPESIFNNFCFSCHGTGWEDAPVIGDDYAWDPRREEGIEVLLARTIDGYNAMPPKGGCADCSEQELRSTVEWMIE